MIAVITQENFLPNEHQYLQHMLDEGLQYLHIRKPWCNADEHKKWLDKASPELLKISVLHQFHQHASEYPVMGLHLKSGNSTETEAFSKSFHSVEEIQSSTINLNYAFLSPVFSSVSKVKYEGKLQEFAAINKVQKPFPVLALGGVTEDRIAQVYKYKFDGFALLGYLWEKPETAAEKFKKMQKLEKKYRK